MARKLSVGSWFAVGLLAAAFALPSHAEEEKTRESVAAAESSAESTEGAALGATADSADTTESLEPAPASDTAPDTKEGTTTSTLPPAGEGELSLSLREAIAMGLENNLDVEIVRHDPLIADEVHRSAKGAHDPNLYGSFNYASTETPIASALQASSKLVEREATGGAGLRGLIPKLGWSYDLAYTGRRIQTTSSISDLSPEYNTGLTGELTMPILKGFLWGEAWTQVKKTGVGSKIAHAQFRQEIMNIVQNIEKAYWQLAADRENRSVANKSLETARALLRQTNASTKSVWSRGWKSRSPKRVWRSVISNRSRRRTISTTPRTH